MLPGFRLETTVDATGSVQLLQLPFPPGQRVEVVVQPLESPDTLLDDAYPLRGLPVTYERPFEPVATDDWEAAE
jgi:hypothetical protein